MLVPLRYLAIGEKFEAELPRPLNAIVSVRILLTILECIEKISRPSESLIDWFRPFPFPLISPTLLMISTDVVRRDATLVRELFP